MTANIWTTQSAIRDVLVSSLDSLTILLENFGAACHLSGLLQGLTCSPIVEREEPEKGIALFEVFSTLFFHVDE
jgi:hypothetical protein